MLNINDITFKNEQVWRIALHIDRREYNPKLYQEILTQLSEQETATEEDFIISPFAKTIDDLYDAYTKRIVDDNAESLLYECLSLGIMKREKYGISENGWSARTYIKQEELLNKIRKDITYRCYLEAAVMYAKMSRKYIDAEAMCKAHMSDIKKALQTQQINEETWKPMAERHAHERYVFELRMNNLQNNIRYAMDIYNYPADRDLQDAVLVQLGRTTKAFKKGSRFQKAWNNVLDSMSDNDIP